MKQHLTILYIYAFSLAATAQEVDVTARFDTSRIYLGDQINYTITIEKPVSFILSVPQFRDSLAGRIEILKGPSGDTVSLRDGRVKITQKYLVTSFDSGFYQVPPVYAELQTREGVKRFYSDYAFLEVMRVRITPPDTASGIFDIVGPYRAPLTIGEVLPWALAALLVAGLTWYIVQYVRQRKKMKEEEPGALITEPAHVIAFRELEALRDEQLWQKGHLKPYYTRLSEIIRRYLENRYGISSPELTTYETLDSLKRTGFRDDESFGRLKTLLTDADLVKFAKYSPDADDNENNFGNGWQFVNATMMQGEQSGLSTEMPGETRKEVTA